MAKLGIHRVNSRILDETTGRAEMAFIAETSKGNQPITVEVYAQRKANGGWEIDVEQGLAQVYKWLATLWGEPATIGRRVAAGGAKGYRLLHGGQDKLVQRYAAMQTFIEQLHEKHPRLSFNALTFAAAEHFGCAQRTIYRHTKNPR